MSAAVIGTLKETIDLLRQVQSDGKTGKTVVDSAFRIQIHGTDPQVRSNDKASTSAYHQGRRLKALELTRFGGHVSFCEGGVHHAEIKTAISG
jgi:hypothetical protein